MIRGLVDENVALSWFNTSRLLFEERAVTRIDRAESGQVKHGACSFVILFSLLLHIYMS